ncbi:MAG: hypothetical protein Q7T86_11795 [Hyphomicrobiaceae bacterium]|nr:hypothetical protein [Hyphomicrobiaceae bacterium]
MMNDNHMRTVPTGSAHTIEDAERATSGPTPSEKAFYVISQFYLEAAFDRGENRFVILFTQYREPGKNFHGFNAVFMGMPPLYTPKGPDIPFRVTVESFDKYAEGSGEGLSLVIVADGFNDEHRFFGLNTAKLMSKQVRALIRKAIVEVDGYSWHLAPSSVFLPHIIDGFERGGFRRNSLAGGRA